TAAGREGTERVTEGDRAIELKPHLAEAWLNKGTALGRLGQFQEALECYDRALQLKPDDALAWSNKAGALLGCPRTCCPSRRAVKPHGTPEVNGLLGVALPPVSVPGVDPEVVRVLAALGVPCLQGDGR
ncbi:MAG: tetratricopeptide repeat protein, partial [Vicinamibacteria bacterium]